MENEIFAIVFPRWMVWIVLGLLTFSLVLDAVKIYLNWRIGNLNREIDRLLRSPPHE